MSAAVAQNGGEKSAATGGARSGGVAALQVQCIVYFLVFQCFICKIGVAEYEVERLEATSDTRLAGSFCVCFFNTDASVASVSMPETQTISGSLIITPQSSR